MTSLRSIAFSCLLLSLAGAPALHAATITVSPATGGVQAADLQSALTMAAPGDTIVLQAGATHTGNFTLPAKEGAAWITIQTSAVGLLPAAGSRVAPADAAAMPKLVPASGSSPVVATAAGAHHYRFVGIEITANAYADQLVVLGSGLESSVSALPHHFIFDRCYIHGDPAAGSRRGIALNAGNGSVVRSGSGVWPARIDWSASEGGVQVLDSYFSDFKHTAYDAQALCGWNGAGPFRIANNYLEATGENVMFGGADPSISNLVPADIEVVGNHMFKPLAWNKWDPAYAGTDWAVKNLFELKNARRVRIEGNVLENNWVDNQNGFSILFTPRNEEGRAPWSVVEDVQFGNNILRHASAGINILGKDDIRRSQQAKRISVTNNLLEDIDHTRWGGSTTNAAGRLFHMLRGPDSVTIDHNTAFQTRAISFSTGHTDATNFGFTNNVVRHNACGGSNNCGIAGDRTNPGDPTLAKYFDGYAPQHNVMWSGYEGWTYSGVNFFPAAVDFENRSRGDYRLALTAGNFAGGYLGAGTDGKDPGVDIAPLYAATGGVVAGTQTSAASSVGSQAATLAGVVNPGGAEMSVWFEWGTSADLAGASSSVPEPVGSGTGSVPVSLSLSSLSPDTVYYYRVASASRGHSDRGAIRSFRTSPQQ